MTNDQACLSSISTQDAIEEIAPGGLVRDAQEAFAPPSDSGGGAGVERTRAPEADRPAVLLAASKAKNRFDQHVSLLAGDLLGYFRRRGMCDSEDLAQEVSSRLAAHRPTLEGLPYEEFRKVAFGFAHNVAREYHRGAPRLRNTDARTTLVDPQSGSTSRTESEGLESFPWDLPVEECVAPTAEVLVIWKAVCLEFEAEVLRIIATSEDATREAAERLWAELFGDGWAGPAPMTEMERSARLRVRGRLQRQLKLRGAQGHLLLDLPHSTPTRSARGRHRTEVAASSGSPVEG